MVVCKAGLLCCPVLCVYDARYCLERTQGVAEYNKVEGIHVTIGSTSLGLPTFAGGIQGASEICAIAATLTSGKYYSSSSRSCSSSSSRSSSNSCSCATPQHRLSEALILGTAERFS